MARRKKADGKTEVPLSSLIDVVFLLIMFFVVTAAIDKESFDETIELAQAHSMKPTTTLPPLKVVIGVSEDGTIKIAGRAYSKNRILDYLKDKRRNWGSATEIIIRPDGRSDYAQISEIMELAGNAGLYKIRITGVLESKK